jgi:hypothetical protein
MPNTSTKVQTVVALNEAIIREIRDYEPNITHAIRQAAILWLAHKRTNTLPDKIANMPRPRHGRKPVYAPRTKL